jgi:hypothetical protein
VNDVSKQYKKIHHLKTLPEYYWPIDTGDKTFEIRKNDRDFQIGDTLFLEEWTPGFGYTGHKSKRTISFVLHGGQFGLSKDYCVLALKEIV